MNTPEKPLRQFALVFLKLGATAFGGPAAHIAMMREEFVVRRKWLSEESFVDLLGATQLIPGPNSTEMAIHIGKQRGGWPGLLIAGFCFIFPAMVMVMSLGWFYSTWGTLPQVQNLFKGMKPVIVAIVVHALWGLARPTLQTRGLPFIVVASLVAALFKQSELSILIVGAVAAILFSTSIRTQPRSLSILLTFPLALSLFCGRKVIAWESALTTAAPLLIATPIGQGATHSYLFWFFLKVGSVLYGSGYVLLSFIRSELVDKLGWLTDAQLLDAVVAGQFTPGPVFTTATFIGYILLGPLGALSATVAIFLPAFVFVAVSDPLIARLRQWPWARVALHGVNAASIGLLAAISVQLGSEALTGPVSLATFFLSLISLQRFRINSAWLLGIGALIGWALA